MRALALAFAALPLLILAPAVKADPGNPAVTSSTELIHQVDVAVQKTQACRARLGQPAYRVRRLYVRRGRGYRRFALWLWRSRLNRCLGLERTVAVPAGFRAVMLCIHPKESADWHLDGLYDGGLQFAPSTWRSAMDRRRARGLAPFAPFAYEATPAEQIRGAFDLTDGSPSAIAHHWPRTHIGCI